MSHVTTHSQSQRRNRTASWVIPVLMLTSVAFTSGCASVTRADRQKAAEITRVGLDPYHAARVTEPAVAGGLAILPGFGNFYLAATSEYTANWGFGVINLLTWPLSVVWAIPQCAIDANSANLQSGIDYYTQDPRGAKELEERKAAYKAQHQGAPASN